MFPVAAAHQHHHFLLGRIDHVRESALQHHVVAGRGQQGQDVGIGAGALHQPVPGVVASQQQDHQQAAASQPCSVRVCG
jgi:hypothetical protein